MALVTHYFVSQHDSANGGDIRAGVIYDNATALINNVIYQNTTTQDGAVSYGGHTFTITTGTPAGSTVDVTSLNQRVVIGTGIKGDQIVGMPGGNVTLVWPL